MKSLYILGRGKRATINIHRTRLNMCCGFVSFSFANCLHISCVLHLCIRVIHSSLFRHFVIALRYLLLMLVVLERFVAVGFVLYWQCCVLNFHFVRVAFHLGSFICYLFYLHYQIIVLAALPKQDKKTNPPAFSYMPFTDNYGLLFIQGLLSIAANGFQSHTNSICTHTHTPHKSPVHIFLYELELRS